MSSIAIPTELKDHWALRPFEVIIRHRRLLWATTCSDIRARFAGSVFGLVWLVMYPLLFLGAYASVFLYIYKVRFAMFDSYEYVALIFCGLVPFLGFSEALGAGVSCVTNNARLIKNTLFPVDLIPVKAVLTSQCTQLVGLAILLVVLAGLGRLTPYAVLVAPVWCCQMLFTIGLIWVLSSINTYFRDLGNVVNVLVLILMMISPIAYTYEMVPPALKPLLHVNPLFYLITAYQSVLMLGKLPPLDVTVPLLGTSLAMFLLGYAFFRRMKAVFADSM